MFEKVKIEMLDDIDLQQYCNKFWKSIEDLQPNLDFTIDYFDTSLNLLGSEENPGPLEFCIALLNEILSHLKSDENELRDKIKYATLLLNLSVRNYDFAALYDIYHQLELDVQSGDVAWSDQDLFDKRISERLGGVCNDVVDPLDTVKCVIDNEDADLLDMSKDDLKLKLGLLLPDEEESDVKGKVDQDFDVDVDKSDISLTTNKKRTRKKRISNDGTSTAKPKKSKKPRGKRKNNSEEAKPAKRKRSDVVLYDADGKPRHFNFVPNHELKGKFWKFCSNCDFRTNTMKALEKHNFESHEHNRLCMQCGYLHTSYNDYLEHMKTHTVQCPICKVPVFMRHRSSLDRHMLIHKKSASTKQNDTNKVPCEICGDLLHENSIKGHVVRKHGEGTFPCDVCDYVAKQKYILQRHRDRHFQTKVTCPECGKDVKNVRDHLSKSCTAHNARQSYICDICDKEFAYQHGLKRHKKSVHQKIKNARCDFCNYECYGKYNMSQHIAQVHTKSWKDFFQYCEECGQKSGNLEFHMKTYHYAKYLERYKVKDVAKTEEGEVETNQSNNFIQNATDE